ncbi:MAG: PrsW family intramembrane metalloprotease [Patescibacteria group bacterium]|nr:PrsW family intramembrane metalloprotease [Patescibacteria group bacterium]
MTYYFYIFLGLVPSIIWLLFYLRKDVHPESNPMVIKIFFYGMLVALPAIFLEMGIFKVLTKLNLPLIYLAILNTFLGGALIEEVMKFLVVKKEVLYSAEFDEPIDAMLYMIIAALGFAASENILILLGLGPELFLLQALITFILRFWGATFLHALCSGLVGYFLALSLFETRKRLKLISLGLLISIVLHGLYNFSIMEIEGSLKLLIPLIILICLAIFLTFSFKRLKRMKSVCKI